MKILKKLYVRINSIHDVNEFVQQARFVDGDVLISRGSYTVDGKSILGAFSIDTSQGCTVSFPEDAVVFETFLQQFAE